MFDYRMNDIGSVFGGFLEREEEEGNKSEH